MRCIKQPLRDGFFPPLPGQAKPKHDVSVSEVAIKPISCLLCIYILNYINYTHTIVSYNNIPIKCLALHILSGKLT